MSIPHLSPNDALEYISLRRELVDLDVAKARAQSRIAELEELGKYPPEPDARQLEWTDQVFASSSGKPVPYVAVRSDRHWLVTGLQGPRTWREIVDHIHAGQKLPVEVFVFLNSPYPQSTTWITINPPKKEETV